MTYLLDTTVVSEPGGIESLERSLAIANADNVRLSSERDEAVKLTDAMRIYLRDRETMLAAAVTDRDQARGRRPMGFEPNAPTRLRLLRDSTTDRLLRLEERAAKLPALMTLPMILFFLPCLFIVVAGPAAIRILNAMN